MSRETGDGRPHVRAGRFVFGDRNGLVLWLVLLAVLTFQWRLTFALTDTNVLANGLVALSEGSLAVEELRFPLDAVGSGQVQQGLRSHDGVRYGRNYGQIVLAVPFLWTLQALSAVADVRLLLAGAWSLTVLAAIHQAGLRTGHPREGRVLGASVGAALFVVSASAASPLDVRLLPVVALQLATLLPAALLGVFVYRLVGRLQGTRVGLAAGATAGFATPVAFWATFPKRHVLVATLLVVGLYCFAVSREGGARHGFARAGAYAAFGLVAWIHAFEGFFAVLTLAAVDLATLRTDRRQVGLIVGALAVALAPTFATNALIGGNPFVPPRIVGSSIGSGGFDAGAFMSVAARAGGGDAAVATAASGFVATSAFVTTVLPGAVTEILGYVVGALVGGLAALTEPERLWHVFVRSGNYAEFLFAAAPYEPNELSVLESMPLLAGFAVLPLAVVRRLRGATLPRPRVLRSLGPARQTDLLVCTLGVVFTVIYLSRLPLHSQLTVRYLFPVYVFGLYGLTRLPAVCRAIEGEWRTMTTAFGLAVAATVALALVGLAALDPARAEAVQAHALAHLALATGLAVVLVVRELWVARVPLRWVAVAVGTVGGTTAAYYLLAGLEYFARDEYALDVARLTAELVPIL